MGGACGGEGGRGSCWRRGGRRTRRLFSVCVLSVWLRLIDGDVVCCWLAERVCVRVFACRAALCERGVIHAVS